MIFQSKHIYASNVKIRFGCRNDIY